MSMIDCTVNVLKKPDPKGDRVVLTFEYVKARSFAVDSNDNTAESSYHTKLGEKQNITSTNNMSFYIMFNEK